MGNIVEVEVEDGGRVRLPEEAMALFSVARKLYLSTRADTREIVLSDRAPATADNRKILDELADLNRTVPDGEYFAPVPDAFLNKQGSRK